MNKSSPSPAPPHLLIFGRYPLPGTTKTRLIPALGGVGAAECQRILTEKTVATARLSAREQQQPPDLFFHHSGGTAQQFRNWLGKGIGFHAQTPGDLGEKMYDALCCSFQQGAPKVVLIGTDIPHLKPHHLSAAFGALEEHEIVLGPAADGGYWLVGMGSLLNIFNNIPWGTERVLSCTLKTVQKLNIKPFLLETLNDLDTPADLEPNYGITPGTNGPGHCRHTGYSPDYATHSGTGKPLISVIIPALNEEDAIVSAIASAQDPNSEIIVVDGGSCDDTVSIARKNGAKVMIATGGRARQQNMGAGVAQGKILLFLHADTLLPSDYATSLFTALLDKNCLAGAFSFQTDSPHPLMRVIAMGVNLRSRLLKLPYGDQALFFRAGAFHGNSGFPATPIAEDLLMIRQMKQKGKISIIKDCVSTSARRWNRIGIVRTTLINLIILTGVLLRYPPEHFAELYGIRQ